MSRLWWIPQPHSLFPGISALVAAISAIAIGLAAPAQAGSADDNASFLAALGEAGIHYNSPGQAVAAGEAVCQLMNEGKTGTDVVWQLVLTNPGLTDETAAKFASIAARVYCPHQLSKA